MTRSENGWKRSLAGWYNIPVVSHHEYSKDCAGSEHWLIGDGARAARAPSRYVQVLLYSVFIVCSPVLMRSALANSGIRVVCEGLKRCEEFLRLANEQSAGSEPCDCGFCAGEFVRERANG